MKAFMKQYIMIAIVALHLINVNLVALEFFSEQHDIHECVIQEHDHVHYHVHNGLKHSHKHTHAPVHTSFSDFFIPAHDTNLVTLVDSNEEFSEVTSQISNPILDSLFRPPKI